MFWSEESDGPCSFCMLANGQPAGGTTSVLYKDNLTVAFKDRDPSAYRHYLVIPVEHIPNINSLEKTKEHKALVEHMLRVGKDLLQRDAPIAPEYRFGFHKPPNNTVEHLHLHCLALPFSPRWRSVKYILHGKDEGWFIEATKLIQTLDPGRQET